MKCSRSIYLLTFDLLDFEQQPTILHNSSVVHKSRNQGYFQAFFGQYGKNSVQFLKLSFKFRSLEKWFY